MKLALAEIEKAHDWKADEDSFWLHPSEDSYFLLNRWKNELGFSTFLDHGCGLGRHAVQFAKAGFVVTAMDLTQDALDKAMLWAKEEDVTITPVLGSMMHLPFADNSFDCLLSYHVVSHTDTKGLQQAVSEIERVVRDGGEFYITICSQNAWYYSSDLPRLDENTIVKTEEGPEHNIPHFYANRDTINMLFANDELISVKQVEEDIMKWQPDKTPWFYHVHGRVHKPCGR